MKLALWAMLAAPLMASTVDLSRAVVVVRPGELGPVEKTAATVLVEEVEKRSGIRLPVVTARPKSGGFIEIAGGLAKSRDGFRVQAVDGGVRISGTDARGELYGVGFVLRKAELTRGRFVLDSALDVTSAPAYPIRGHQLGYRPQANSYDAWSVAQFEQYIRELTFFGVNAIEGIPFHDDRKATVMKVPRRDMNRAISDICFRYGLEYWVWTPADFDLKNTAKRDTLLTNFEELFHDSRELTGVFFPGGDPGSNPPDLVLPFLEQVGTRMKAAHPQAKIWVSLQWFSKEQADEIYRYIDEKRPEWFGGLVAGPSSPPVAATRLRLPRQYGLRLYPDLTHNKISQFQVPSWDQAYALTLGREAINPRPAEMAIIHNWFAPYSDGFISYSDGAHDDVNKTVFSALSWDPNLAVRDILVDYARAYFGAQIDGPGADGILALEKNWRGVLADNGAVEGTLGLWQKLDKEHPELAGNWRWQMCLLRANYDAYVRRRLLNESRLEVEANEILDRAAGTGAEKAMTAAGAVLDRALKQPVGSDLRQRIEALCAQLFESIGLQTSVTKYHASGEERGAVLDFVDSPLNNRWWLEDEFGKIRKFDSEEKKVARLRELARWERPGAGSFYDNVGNPAKSPHVFRSDVEMFEPGDESRPEPTFWWWNDGRSRARLSWQATMWPRAMVYEGLDAGATYVVRTSGYGQCLLRVNGERVEASTDGREMGEQKEFPVPARFVKERKLVLTFDKVAGEEHLNWRQHSRLSEVWLIRR